jgi:anion-transporting  ArsA/GET3 family ATPase
MPTVMLFEPAQRIVFVTGKGGVGKSTVAAALARAEADRAGSALLVEFEGSQAAGQALRGEGRGVRHVVIDYFDALVEILASILGSRLLSRMLVNHRAVRRMVRAIPALRELSLLERVRALALEEPPVRAIVDFPASGHSLDWLRVPVKAERFLRVGPAAELCRTLREQILAVERSAIVVVSTVEPVVASETRYLCHRITSELERAPSLLVANRVPRSPTPEQLAHLREAARRDPAWSAFSSAAAEDTVRAEETERALMDLRAAAGSPLVRVPEMYVDPSPHDVIAHLRAESAGDVP